MACLKYFYAGSQKELSNIFLCVLLYFSWMSVVLDERFK